ncbi:MAG TPA: dCMP deaminase family protein [Candidatus Thermoplasmatota archaeon]|nr:dCMP deaminase family protein [Candidatus Thermoplasmatota archaeon]
MTNRPSYDEYFMSMAFLAATRSTCLRRQVGAVLVKNKHVLATGYNGPPKGMKHCDETGCLRDELNVPSGERHEICRGLHAEQNAIIQASVFGISIDKSIIYVTDTPCMVCAKMLINAGVQEIIYGGDYPDDLARQMIEESHMRIRQFHGRIINPEKILKNNEKIEKIRKI